MKYLLIIYSNEAEYNARMSEDDIQADIAAYYAYDAFLGERLIEGEALESVSKAKTVRVRDGKTLTTDGPFAETKDQLIGFYLVDCKDQDEAIELAALIPGATHGGIEVRPCVVFE